MRIVFDRHAKAGSTIAFQKESLKVFIDDTIRRIENEIERKFSIDEGIFFIAASIGVMPIERWSDQKILCDTKNFERLSRCFDATSGCSPSIGEDIFRAIEKYIFAVPVVFCSCPERFPDHRNSPRLLNLCNFAASALKSSIGLKPLRSKGFKLFDNFRQIFVWPYGRPYMFWPLASKALVWRGLRGFQRG